MRKGPHWPLAKAFYLLHCCVTVELCQRIPILERAPTTRVLGVVRKISRSPVDGDAGRVRLVHWVLLQCVASSPRCGEGPTVGVLSAMACLQQLRADLRSARSNKIRRCLSSVYKTAL